MEAKRSVAVDIPETIIRGYLETENQKPSIQLKHILEDALPKYFEDSTFLGMQVGFSVPVCERQGKKRSNAFKRVTFGVSEETFCRLDAIRSHTLISMKTAAEIIILKELLQGGEADHAENCVVHH